MSFRKSASLLSPLAAAALAAAGLASVSAHAGSEHGMRVTRDAQTGQLRAPTAEENKALDEAAAKGRAAGKAKQRVGLATGRLNPMSTVAADGTVMEELDESSLAYTVVRRNADGSLDMSCVTGSEAAQKALKAPKFASRPVAKAAKEQLDEK